MNYHLLEVTRVLSATNHTNNLPTQVLMQLNPFCLFCFHFSPSVTSTYLSLWVCVIPVHSQTNNIKLDPRTLKNVSISYPSNK